MFSQTIFSSSPVGTCNNKRRDSEKRLFTGADEKVRLYTGQVVVPEMKRRQPGPVDGRRHARKVHVHAVHLAQAVVRLGARAHGIERARLTVLPRALDGTRARYPQHHQQREHHHHVYESHGRLRFKTVYLKK